MPIELPHNISAERHVLGAMMLDETQAFFGIEKLSSKDFYNKANSIIFETMKELQSQSSGIDVLTVADRLKTKGKDQVVGGKDYLSDLTDDALATTNFESYVEIVMQKSQLRSLIKAASEISDMAQSSSEAAEVLELAEKSIFEISLRRSNTDFVPLSEIVYDLIENIRESEIDPGALIGLDTGLDVLNDKLSGFQKSDLVILAARPSMGKTALALNFARNSALKSKASVGIFSLEMSKEQLALRMLAMASNVELEKIKRGALVDAEFELLREAVKEYQNTEIHVSQCPGANINEIKSQCRKLKSKSGLDLVIIDYLQLMSGEGESHQIAVSNISRSLKALAMELDCPVITLSQLSRKPEERKNHRPMLSDLRDSGSIEQDADVVMFIYRDEYYDDSKTDSMGITELSIAKHRNGEVGTIKLHWKPEYQLFTSLALEGAFPTVDY